MGERTRRLLAFAAAIWPWGRGWRPPVTAVPGSILGTHYPDAGVQEMASEDGGYRFNTAAWGRGNRVVHGLLAVLHSAVTHALAVRLWADKTLGEVAAAHAQRAGEVPRAARGGLHRAGGCGPGGGAEDGAGREAGRPRPGAADAAWRVLGLLALLGVGDLTMTSTAMMVFNISDRPYVSWLPFSALQVAAVPVVVGVLAAAHFLGEAIKAHRCEPRQHQVIKMIVLAALGGGLSLSLSVAESAPPT